MTKKDFDYINIYYIIIKAKFLYFFLTLLYPLLSLADLWHPRVGLVAGIWASRTVQYLVPTLLRALPLLIYSSIPTNNHPAITNTNRYNKVSVCLFVFIVCACTSSQI